MLRLAVLLICTLALALASRDARCAKQLPHRSLGQTIDAVPFSDRPLTVTAVDVVGEDHFVRALSRSRLSGASVEARQQGMALAALVGDLRLDSEGLAGRPTTIALGSTPVIVARSLKDRHGVLFATDLYVVVAAGLRGRVPGLRLKLPRSATRERLVGELTCAPLIGAQPGPALTAVLDARGKLDGVPLNAERASGLAGGKGIGELRIFADRRTDLPANRLACSRRLESPADAPMPEAGTARWKVPLPAVLVSEVDYLAAVGKETAGSAHLLPVEAAAHVVVVANHPKARAIEGSVQTDVGDPTVAVVARDLRVEGDRVRATEFYLVPWPRGGIPGMRGGELFIDLGRDLPAINLGRSLCGPVVWPDRDGGCRGGFCTGLPGWQAGQGGYGDDRVALGLNRATLRWPGGVDPLDGHIRVIACSAFEPPRRNPPLRCDIDVFTGRPILEVCNGRDDNCNGQIDEGSACTVPQSCPCTPRTCGTTTCGSLPDGCGNVLNCGGACP